MVKRKSLRFLSIALAVVVVGSALYYGTSKYISADINTDGEWAYFKNLTTDEMRTIVFDAYISNINKGENQFVVTKKALVTYDDLVDGKISKVPVDSLKRYEYWQSYWDGISSRNPKYIVAQSNSAVAHAAEAAGSTDAAKTALKNRVIAYVNNHDDGTLGAKIRETALAYVIPAINVGDVTKVADEDMEALLADYYRRGDLVENSCIAGIREAIGGTTMTNLTEAGTAAAYNVAQNKAEQFIAGLTIAKTRYSRRQILSAYEAILIESKDYDNPPRLDEAYFMSTVVPRAAKMAESMYSIVKDSEDESPSVPEAAQVAAPAADASRFALDGTTSQEDLPSYYNTPERLAVAQYEQDIVSANGNGDGTQNTNADQATILLNNDGVAYDEASAASIRSGAAVKASVTQKTAMDMEHKGDPLASIYPVEEISGGQVGGDVAEDDSNALSALSKINTGWTGVGTVGINKKTGNFEYKSAIKYNGADMGYMSFDPANARVDAELHYTLAGKEVTLYAEPTTGEMYLELGNANGDPLYAIGGSISTTELTLVDGQVISKPVTKKVNGLMKVSVARDGSIGGSFKLMGRVFNYNPTSKAFEIPINLDKGGLAGVGDAGGSKVLYLDSKGGVRGNITLLNKNGQTAGLYMTSAGTVALTYDISRVGGSQLGALSVDNNGVVNGTVNIGKVFGENNLDVFVGFGSDGISSVNVPIGNIGGNALGLTVTKDGTVSLGSFVMVAGLPVPVNLTTNNTGGTVLNFFLFKFTFGGANVDEVLDPPSPVFTDEGAVNLDFVQMGKYEKTYGWLPPKTNRYYQRVFIELPEEEKYERAKIIFDKYNEHLGRNPSQEEFMHAYIYNSHMKIGTECRNMDEGGHQARVDQLKAALDGLITQNSWHLPDGAGFLDGNKREYDCIKAGTAPEKCEDRPKSLMPTSALEAFKVDAYDKLSEMSKEDQYKTIKEFLDAIEILAKDDPEIERIIQEFINNHEENPTSEPIGDGTTVRFVSGFNTFVVPEYDEAILAKITSSPTATASATATTSVTATASTTVSPGALGTTTTTSAKLGYVDTAPFTNKGLEIFQYSASSTNKWLSTANGDSIPYMKAGTGYYIYNPGTTVGVEIKKADVVETAVLKPSLQKGWNLVANSTEKSLNLGEITHSIVAGENKTIVAMAKADEIHNRMYLIQDGTATEATKAFKLLNPLATDITAQIVGSLKPYWVFVK